jgi:ABC-type multidrug transport system ATPase subunit
MSAYQENGSMLSIKQLSKTYDNGVKAINNVTLDIPHGMFGLLGPNGAGKSSLMRTIATLQDPDSGSIHFDGLDVLAQPEALRRQLGYLPQDFGVYPKVSAEVLLNHFAVLKGLTARGERKEAVEALLQQTNLWEARKRNLGTYSGGMRQRFGIAQALLGAPKLVIVDEPTAGLDPDERNRFLNLLAKIGEQVVVILSTHIVDDVTDLCPRMAMIVKGEVLVQGEPQAAIDTLRSKVWRRSVSAEALADYQQRFNVLHTRLVGGKPHINVYADSQPDDGFRLVEPDLEDVYFLHVRGAQRAAAGTNANPAGASTSAAVA